MEMDWESPYRMQANIFLQSFESHHPINMMVSGGKPQHARSVAPLTWMDWPAVSVGKYDWSQSRNRIITNNIYVK
jgi:hypothetical protein